MTLNSKSQMQDHALCVSCVGDVRDCEIVFKYFRCSSFNANFALLLFPDTITSNFVFEVIVP